MGGIADSIIKVLEKVGLFERIKSKLFQDPPPKKVFDGLGRIIYEVNKSFDAINYVFDKFNSLSFNDDKIEDSKKFLEDLKNETIKVPSKDAKDVEGPPLFVAIEYALGSCHEISNLYNGYLDDWISKKLRDKKVHKKDKQDYKALQKLVRDQLTKTDEVFFNQVHDLKLRLKKASEGILALIDTPDPKKKNVNRAKEKLRKQKAYLKKPRVELGKTIENLSHLRADFISKSKLVTG